MTLHTRLDELAAGAPDAAALDVDALRGRIARRRRTRRAAAGGAMVLTVAAAGTAAAVLLPRTDPPAQPAIASPSPVPPLEAYPFPDCGTPFTFDAPVTDPRLTMDVDFASPAANLDDQLGEVTITNVSDARVEGDVGAGPSLIVTQDGRVVGGPVFIQGINLSLDLAPGESAAFRVFVGHGHCDRGSVTEIDTQFPPGTYDVYVSWYLEPGIPGRSEPNVRLFDGPFTIEVR
ncbi:hypothetical protein [Jiangella anatolica]|uniref:Uncharacterized protein n=1 Tax=Jiangella anatolica TaxID=2670374 RepID=A0A2W2B0Y1_9ACTN|nr:hypothetical protein [Jiangella anatolica]PZF81065.1 hypothetical protein C1I92_22840 [Jiangella anatolica]